MGARQHAQTRAQQRTARRAKGKNDNLPHALSLFLSLSLSSLLLSLLWLLLLTFVCTWILCSPFLCPFFLCLSLCWLSIVFVFVSVRVFEPRSVFGSHTLRRCVFVVLLW